jgi:hypothetical protein
MSKLVCVERLKKAYKLICRFVVWPLLEDLRFDLAETKGGRKI